LTTDARPESRAKHERLSGLDGIRGLAALYVVFHHILESTFPGYPADHAPWWAGWFIYGRFAVVVFIVLSGFSLGLSPARHRWRLDGVRRFAGRRARRILPAYLAALAFSLAVAWLVVPQPGEEVPTGKSVAVNGLLVQNLVRAPSPNKSFWSMAVEAQLYVAFPLLILLVRRFGALVMVATVTLLVATVGILGPQVPRLETLVVHSPPDLAALFAIGIMAAGIIGARKARGGRLWPWLGAAAAAPVLLAISLQGSRWTLVPRHLLWVDLALGPAVACLLLGVASGRPRPFVRLLDSRPIRSLGLSSYSLYLVHEPIVVVVYQRIVGPRYHHGPVAFLIMVAIVVPVAIVFARMFAAVFERPFLRQSARSQRPLVSHLRFRKVAHLRS
jgi:peptidoglycan/LPS O-acetylase OafA/YrhL